MHGLLFYLNPMTFRLIKIQASANENQSGIQSDPHTGDAEQLSKAKSNKNSDGDKDKSKDKDTRTFTGKQIKGLRDQWSSYTRLMVEANILDSQVFNQQNDFVLEMIGAMAGEVAKDTYKPPTFKEMIDRSCWHSRMNSAMEMFREMFTDLTMWGPKRCRKPGRECKSVDGRFQRYS